MGKHGFNLLIDQGNSFCKVATARDGVLSPISTHPQLSEEILRNYFQERDQEISAIYSKVGTSNEEAFKYLQKHAHRVVVLDSNTLVPLKEFRYDRTQLGSDRLALIVAGSSLYPHQSLLVIDIGTAITYDFVHEDGVYLGGDITPGPQTRSKSLHEATAKLPEADFMTAFETKIFSENTSQAIANGITRGITAEIESYILQAQSYCPQSTTIITGGYGSFFANRIKNKILMIPNLLMIGLNLILEYNDSIKK